LGGEVVIISPLSVWILGGLLSIALALALAFASSAEYARKEVVPGWLVPETGAVRALALRGGVAVEVLVSPGDYVAVNQPIARIDLSYATSSGDLAGALMTTIESLEVAAGAQMAASQRRLGAERERLEKRLFNARTQRTVLAAQIQHIDARMIDAEATATWAKENFEEGLTTRIDAENWENAARNIRHESLQLRRTDVQLKSEISDLEQQIQAIDPELDAAAATYQSAQAELSERLTRAEAEAEYVVTSPINGFVEAISINEGQTLASGATVAVLSPEGSELIAELFVPSRAAGFIQQGQDVRVKYDAFPFQRFGAAEGEVLSISRTILSPSEIPFPGALSQELVFRVKAKLKSTSINAYGEQIPLRTGMLLNADIVFDRRSLLEWLLDPIYAVGRR
jgi:membrane fusion protein